MKCTTLLLQILLYHSACMPYLRSAWLLIFVKWFHFSHFYQLIPTKMFCGSRAIISPQTSCVLYIKLYIIYFFILFYTILRKCLTRGAHDYYYLLLRTIIATQIKRTPKTFVWYHIAYMSHLRNAWLLLPVITHIFLFIVLFN